MKTKELVRPEGRNHRRHSRGHTYYQHTPRVNVQKTNDAYILEMAVPGVPKDEIQLNMEGRTLTVQHLVNDKASKEYTIKHFDLTGFERSFVLNRGIDTEAITATYHHGVLVITLPFSAERKARTIDIS